MGGFSSGRYRTRNRGSVEQALRLDIRAMRRRGMLVEGVWAQAPWRWTWSDGREAGSIQVIANLTSPEDRHVTLSYSVGGEPRRERVALVATPMRFGGVRYYFVCPQTALRCEVLACVGGRFASIKAQRLSYASQSADEIDRLRRARDRVEARLWPKDKALGSPRGRNAAELIARWEALDEAFEDAMNVRLVGFARRLGALDALDAQLTRKRPR